MAAIGEVVTGMLTALNELPAARGKMDETLRMWHASHRQDVARLAHLRQIN